MKSTTTFTKSIGFAFILLSVLRLTPIINVNGKLLLYVGVAALLLILTDLFEFIMEGIAKKKGVQWERALEISRKDRLFVQTAAARKCPFPKTANRKMLELEPIHHHAPFWLGGYKT
ncbi:hypothetical protein PaeBR_11570 [Paenibacillus sp. BR2-3]|uniref:hypothetical protein n=1 Tax=Paenibacillus sp. BR2-3 TaxID=3048494 RepID=UPI003977DEBC